MKTLTQGLAVAVFACSATAVLATSALQSNDQRIEINAGPSAVAAAEAVLSHRHIDAMFTLSSGRHLSVLSAGDTLSVQFDRLPEATLRHDGKGNFVSMDRKVVMQFDADGTGEPQQVRVILPAHWR